MIRVGVAGAAHPHVRMVLAELAGRNDVRLVAAADPEPADRAAHLGGLDVEPGGDPYAVAERPDVDVVVVAGRYAGRAGLIARALEAGKQILADKPVCLDATGFAMIERAARSSDGQLSIMFDKRTYPETRQLAELVATGELGSPHLFVSSGPHKLLPADRPFWFLDPVQYGHIANDLPVHDLDLFLSLTGATGGTISATAGSARSDLRPGYLDHVAMLVETDRARAGIDASWLEPHASAFHGSYRLCLTGSEGTAVVDWARHTLTLTTNSVPARVSEHRPQERPMKAYFDSIVGGEPPEVGTAASLLATEAALAARRSCLDHVPVAFGAEPLRRDHL